MSMTIDLKMLGFIVIGIALLILIIYLILLVRKAIDTLKKADVVIQDSQEITGVAAKRTKQLDGAIDDLADSITGVASAFRGKQEATKNLGTFLSALAAIKNVLTKDKETDSRKK